MLDLDNTIAEYKEPAPPHGVLCWAAEVKANGIKLFIVSNSVRKTRVESFGEALGAGVILDAHKPSPKNVRLAMETAGFTPEDSALIGDQVITDTLAANRAGVVSIIVKPKRLSNFFFAVRYALEAPFRAMCRNKLHNRVRSET